MTVVIAIGSPAVPFLVVLLITALVLIAVWILPRASGHGPSGKLPRIRPRPLPSLNGEPPIEQAGNGGPVQLIVGGRTYEVTDGPETSPKTCPWCLGSLDGVPPNEIIHGQKPYCGRAAHRRHNEEHGGCGGVCSVVHA